MYLITDTSEYELPLAVVDILTELARICGTRVPYLCRVIKGHRKTRLFNGHPARIYKISNEEENEHEQSKVNSQSEEVRRSV